MSFRPGTRLPAQRGWKKARCRKKTPSDYILIHRRRSCQSIPHRLHDAETQITDIHAQLGRIEGLASTGIEVAKQHGEEFNEMRDRLTTIEGEVSTLRNRILETLLSERLK